MIINHELGLDGKVPSNFVYGGVRKYGANVK